MNAKENLQENEVEIKVYQFLLYGDHKAIYTPDVFGKRYTNVESIERAIRELDIQTPYVIDRNQHRIRVDFLDLNDKPTMSVFLHFSFYKTDQDILNKYRDDLLITDLEFRPTEVMLCDGRDWFLSIEKAELMARELIDATKVLRLFQQLFEEPTFVLQPKTN